MKRSPSQPAAEAPKNTRHISPSSLLLFRLPLSLRLSLWQSHLGELAAEQREAERLRQAAGAALPGGSGSVATAA